MSAITESQTGGLGGLGGAEGVSLFYNSNSWFIMVHVEMVLENGGWNAVEMVLENAGPIEAYNAAKLLLIFPE